RLHALATTGSPDRESAFDRHRSRSKRQQLLRLAPIILYGQPSADGAASLHWTATCTNLNGRQEKVPRIPVEQLSVTLPPDADGPELLAT
ncbi:hypothetical protein ABZ402_48605, partial [Streptomyces mirabilis]|uniref:hypothetical protein n=1 Tax=Streptomyces mirabilis TaxID=68239 RepID=UPI0033D5BFF4